MTCRPEIVFLPSVDSTNNYVKSLAGRSALPHLYTVCTWCQTAGRGQQGNSWESEQGKNLSFTTVLDASSLSQERLWLVSEVCALAVAETLREFEIEAEVKWPNDVYVGDKKICGILIETVLQGKAVRCCLAGIGVNVNQTIFRSDAPNPVSMKNITGREYDKEDVLRRIISALDRLWQQAEDDESALRTLYMSRLYRRKGLWLWRRREADAAPVQIVLQPAPDAFAAGIENVDVQGRLVLRQQDGTLETFCFKEIQYVFDNEKF